MNWAPSRTALKQSRPSAWRGLRTASRPVAIVTLLAGLFSRMGFGAAASPRGLLVWNFDQGVVNAWGGVYNAFGAEPSRVRTFLDANIHRASAQHSLRVTVHREAEGFGGVWLDFYSSSTVPRRYLDASPYRYLSFWMKGQKGREDFDLQLADDAWQKLGDSIPARPLHAYLPKGVTTKWQEVLIPLRDFRGVNLRQLVRLVLNFTPPGDSQFYLDRLALKREKSSAVPAPKRKSAVGPSDGSEKARGAMWVWNTRNLFDSTQPESRNQLFEFCARANVAEIYLSLDLSLQTTAEGPRFDLRHPDQYQTFLEQAHRQGFLVAGLAGTPEWAGRENHPLALAAANALLTYNRSRPASARFDGLHFDVEPYALPAYSDSISRSQVLEDFLELISRTMEQIRSDSNLHLSCDVPAWFYPVGELERQKLLVTFRGEVKTVGEHLTDLLDTVTIMDYENEADGAGGIIASGIPSLTYAASQGKKIRVGLETSAESDSTIYFVCGLPLDDFHQRLAKSKLQDQLFLDDFRIAIFSDEVNLHVGLAAPAELQGEARAALDKALLRLARELGAAADPDRFPVVPILDQARAAISQTKEWKGFESFEIPDPETHRAVIGFRTVHRMDLKSTFHGLSREVFDEESRSVVEWLSRYPSFAGLAIHSYESFRGLTDAQD